MFTGIIEAIGTVTSVVATAGASSTITIEGSGDILTDANLGDSIAINGTCLTITTFDKKSFTVSVSPETLRRTNLEDLSVSDHVNLERAVQASTRMGGHFVQGHVDTVADILAITPDGDCLTFRLRPRETTILQHIVEKGFITLDGASLTITHVDNEQEWFEVMLITYTQEKIVMSGKQVGARVNVEADMVGKYVEKSVRGYLDGLTTGKSAFTQQIEMIVKNCLERDSRFSR